MHRNVKPEDQASFAARVAEIAPTNYSYPTSREEYWEIVDRFWPDLFNIILMYCPRVITDLDSPYVGQTTSVVLVTLKQKKDLALVDFFEKAWASAPDDGKIHLIRGWGVLCDLCSESHLLYEGPQEF